MTESHIIRSVHIIVKGKVQGVFYRASAQKRAQELGVKGWVKNNPDGSVEALLESEASKIDELLIWCKKGPSHAIVESVTILSNQSISTYTKSNFEIRH